MADIKFMDISENDNPATTDSILVGNQENGVKRTTLGKIGDMFAVHGLLHFESVSKVVTQGNAMYNIDAPDVKGYKFAFWLNAQTNGFMAGCYVTMPTNSNTNLFIVDENKDNYQAAANGTNNVQAFAVYVKSTVA